eukprot:Gb_18030 [translate_table: standard]
MLAYFKSSTSLPSNGSPSASSPQLGHRKDAGSSSVVSKQDGLQQEGRRKSALGRRCFLQVEDRRRNKRQVRSKGNFAAPGRIQAASGRFVSPSSSIRGGSLRLGLGQQSNRRYDSLGHPSANRTHKIRSRRRLLASGGRRTQKTKRDDEEMTSSNLLLYFIRDVAIPKASWQSVGIVNHTAPDRSPEKYHSAAIEGLKLQRTMPTLRTKYLSFKFPIYQRQWLWVAQR